MVYPVFIKLLLLFGILGVTVLAGDQPHSCADIYTADITRTRGEYTIYNRQGQAYRVYCDIHDGYGYTYISPATTITVNIADLVQGSDNSHVLIRSIRITQQQYVAKVEQISRDAKLPLSIQYNAHVNYSGILNFNMTPYLYIGFTPTSKIHKGEVYGYRVNGHDVNYTNCDGNPNSYFTSLFNQRNLAVTGLTSGYSIREWVYLATKLTSEHKKIPKTFFAEFETHFGGRCGGYATTLFFDRTHMVPILTGAAVGIRYNVVCPTPVNIQHGTKQASGSYMVGSTVTYTCDVGYTMLSGDATRTCSQTGKWTGTLPFCGQFPCESQPCQNGGLCFEVEGATYVCGCAANFGGQFCQNNIQN